jgi:hypothetical protein
MLVEIVAGVLIGYAVLLVVAVVALPRHDRRAAPPDRPEVGTVGAAGRPAGTAMLTLDVWDAVVVVLIVGMVLAVPVVGGVVAALLVPALVLAPLLVVRALGHGAAPRSHRSP